MTTSQDFSIEVATTLADVIPSVRDIVKHKLVEREQQARADAVLVVIEKINTANKAFQKIKEDQAIYGSDGTVLQNGFSKAKLDERKKAQEEIDRLEKALAAAIAPAEGQKPDFSKVKDIAKGSAPAATPEA